MLYVDAGELRVDMATAGSRDGLRRPGPEEEGQKWSERGGEQANNERDATAAQPLLSGMGRRLHTAAWDAERPQPSPGATS
eukprot:3349140-Rhodomonas_salina.1